jgi:hypothetical protein
MAPRPWVKIHKALKYSINSFVNWIAQHMKLGLSRHRIGYEWLTFKNIAQRFIEHYEVWSWAMVVELNQHYNSKNWNLWLRWIRILLK